MIKFFRFTLICLFYLSLGACNKIDSDPITGASQLNKELTKLADSNNLQEAHNILSEYWDAYQDGNRTQFLLALRGELMANDKVVNFIVQTDFHQFPMFGTYMKNLQQVAYEEALSNLGHVLESGDNSSFNGSAAAKGILLGSLLADCEESGETEQAYDMLRTAYDNLTTSPELYRIEFYASFQYFIKNSGDVGVRAYNCIRKLDDPIVTDFMRLGLESKLEYN